MNSEIKTALLLIATGEKYWKYIDPLLASAETYLFPHEAILWTDSPYAHKVRARFSKQPLGFPGETLHRYHTFLEQRDLLASYDFLMYCDIDMLFVRLCDAASIVSDGITATLHPGYVGTPGTPDRNPGSTAYIPVGIQNKYFCGGFNGGTAESFLRMANYIKIRIDQDTQNGVMAIWHDESHLNHYLYHNPPARILGPEYCYPEGCDGRYAGNSIGPPKLIALTKT
jgi:histo-blood group ABO system transferase